MTSIENAAHEAFIVLKDAGMVWDGVTGSADDWPDEIEALLAEHISAAIADALEAQTGR